MKAPLPSGAKARIAGDILDDQTLENDKLLFAMVDEMSSDIEIPVEVKVIDGVESVELVKAGEIMAKAVKRQEGLEKIEMCVRGTK
jgi:hypothetical protein